MSSKKKVFSSLAALTVGVVAGSAIALSPVVAFAADDHGHAATGDKACSGEKKSCSGEKKACSGEKKAEQTPHAEKSCSGEKKSCSGAKH